ncbi:fatty-acid amide hydrolase 2-A-like [Dermacentor silvarum]|uniref:fatty-acid amide hydrolase 2-A-like n=1 Tax=Dermacentor silvarum TaxID=543639 RepID=UPI00210134A6|nr:fatty-acid amide hydrolase 2-A-like [Dermacentor silvarum]
MPTAWPYCVRPVPSRRRSPTSRSCACGGSRTTTCTDVPTIPYDSRRICGRSSALSSHTGGEGSLIASAGSVIGVGTDIGGSIRMPAFFKGIFDHKPRRGLVSNKGQYPPARDHSLDACLVAGPMCRYAQDLEPMLAVMAGPRASLVPFNTKVDWSKVTVYYRVDDLGGALCTPVHPEMKGRCVPLGTCLTHSRQS